MQAILVTAETWWLQAAIHAERIARVGSSKTSFTSLCRHLAAEKVEIKGCIRLRRVPDNTR